MPDSTSRGRQAVAADRTAETRQKLIEAAVDLFLNVGYHAVRIEDITAYAGVGKGTFYLHFGNKRDLLLAYYQSVVDLVEAADVGSEGLDYFSKTDRRISGGMDPAHHWSSIDTFLRIAANSVDEETASAARQVHALMVERGNREIQRAIQAGAVRPVDPELAGLTVAGMTEVLSWHLAHDASYDLETVVAFMEDLHVRILAPRPGFDACAQTIAILEAVERVEAAVNSALPPAWPAGDQAGTKAKIVRAAVDLFLDVGYQNLRVDEITERAGIGKGTFYHHFPSKRDLLLEYFRHTSELICTSESIAAEAQFNELERIAFRLRLWLEHDTKWNRVVTFIRVMANSSDPEIAAAAWDAYTCIIELNTKDFEEGIRRGTMREIEPRLSAVALAGMQEVLAWRSERDDTYDQGTILALMADVYCRAFLK